MVGHIQRVVDNGSISRWRSTSSDVPQGSVLGSELFNVFNNDIDSGTECALSKFANDTKLNGAVDTSKVQDAIQRDLEKFKQWHHVNFMRFNSTRCKVLY